MTKISAYSKLMRFDKPIGILLLLWPTLWPLWLINKGFPELKMFLIFILGVVVMRSAGCVINDIVDKDIDPSVERTKTRPLASQSISLSEAYLLLLILLSIALTLVLQLNLASFFWALGGLLITVVYPFCKRFFSAPQLILGFAFSWSIPMVYAANNLVLNTAACLLWLSVGLWIVMYDTFYALADKEDDLKIGINSTAILFGKRVGFIALLLQISVVLLWCFVGLLYELNFIYFSSLIVAACFFVRQQFLIGSRDPKQCLKAFLENNYVGAVIFLGVFLDLLFIN
tara:strand:+ start:673 stop:1530 length:858 start_codon:yes stop_codon:yes gene_type:complete